MKMREIGKVPPKRIGRINKNGVKTYPHEESTAVFLAQFGFNIEFIKPQNIYKTHNADFLVNGAVWETKSPSGGGKNTIGRQFREASKQSSLLILDLRRIKLPAEKAEQQAKACFERAKNIKRLLLITKNERLLDFNK